MLIKALVRFHPSEFLSARRPVTQFSVSVIDGGCWCLCVGIVVVLGLGGAIGVIVEMFRRCR